MKISPTGSPAAAQVAHADSISCLQRQAAAAASVVAPDVVVGERAACVQAAQVELAAMPDVDQARVAEIKAALARGDISFDPAKLAQLVLRHHGGAA